MTFIIQSSLLIKSLHATSWTGSFCLYKELPVLSQRELNHFGETFTQVSNDYNNSLYKDQYLQKYNIIMGDLNTDLMKQSDNTCIKYN